MNLDTLVDDITDLIRGEPSHKWPSAIKMSMAAQGKLIGIEAARGLMPIYYPPVMPVYFPAGDTISSVCGIPVVTDDGLGEDEVILVYDGKAVCNGP